MGDYVVSAPYTGHERRKSSVQERTEYREAHPEDTDVDARWTWHTWIPRPVLITLLTIALTGLVWYEVGWRDGVNEHIAHAAQFESASFGRIGSLEVEVGALKEAVRDLGAVSRETQKDQLTFYRWTAERAGDTRAAAHYGRRLDELGDKEKP